MADSIRDALTQAFSEAEKETPEPQKESPSVTDSEVSQTPPETTASEEMREVKPAPIGAAAALPPTPGTPAEGAKGAPVAVSAPPPAVGAPNSWKAAERTFWDKVPPEAQAAIQRREREIQTVLSTTAEARKLQQNFNALVDPYIPLMKAHGVTDPIPALKTLLNVRAGLELGTKEQKAQIVAQMIHQFGVDVESLDGLLVKGPQPHAPQPQPLNPQAIPELQPLFKLAEQYKASQAKKVEQTFATIEAKPHYEDLREEMADIMEVAFNRGREMTLEQAYTAVLALHPELKPEQQAASPSDVSAAAALLAKSRKAASTVVGAPRGSPTAKPTTLREQIAAAMED